MEDFKITIKRNSKLLLPVLFLLLNNDAFSQWSTSPTINNAVSTAVNDQWGPNIISDGMGGTIITWYDDRSGTSNFKIYAQRMNASGIAQWTPNGVAISTGIGGKYSPLLVSDGNGGAIIVWKDYRSLTTADIYAQRINGSGVVQWAVNGIAICTAANEQFDHTIVSDGSGGAIVTWIDERNGVFNSDIYAQRINGNGVTQWISNGVAVSSAANNQMKAAITSDGSSGAIIVWEDQRVGLTNTDVYAQRIDASGTISWTIDGVAISAATDLQVNPSLVYDTNGGAIITWHDFRIGLDANIYAQRINSTGLVQWLADGVVISAATGGQLLPEITVDGSGGAIIAWEDWRNGSSNSDIYSQRISASGVVQWTVNGVVMCMASNRQQYLEIHSDEIGGAIVAWEDYRSGVGTHNSDIYAQRVDLNGLVQWSTNGVAISTALNGQFVPTISMDVSNGAVITWYDFRNGIGFVGYDIFAQRVSATGVLCGNPDAPGSIAGASNVCSTTSNTYSILPISGATSYTWTLPSGWTGTSTTTSITATASATSGNISVTANNSCGSSTPQTLAITVNAPPAQPGTIAGNAIICSGSSNTYNVSTVSGATSYTWTLPSGWTGTSTTASITAIASTTSGNISVTANNSCGSSTPQTLAITVNAPPAQPGTIAGNAIICSGSSNTYSVSTVSGATSYTWTLPSGWTGTSTTASITATASPTSGNISVTANNSCGSSTPQTLAITVNAPPAQPGTIAGNAIICSGSSNTYNVSTVSGATSYTWTLPSGWTGTSTTTSITATASATSGNISVTANNSCGSSSSQILDVSVTLTSKPTITVDLTNSAAPILTSSSGDTYQWFKDGIPVGTSRTFVVTESGVYTVTVTINGCSSILSDQQAMIITGDITSNSSLLTTLYPNPVSDYAVLSLGGFEKNQPVSISIVDMLGRIMERSTEFGQDDVFINMLTYPDGKYVALLQQRNTRISLLFIKIRK